MIWLTSDLHFCHNREFLYGPRGFSCVEDMNEAIVKNWNEVVKPNDDVYCLGDIMLNNNELGLELLKKLNGKIHVVMGNHDTNARLIAYTGCHNVVEVVPATYIRYKGYYFFCTHFPCLTASLNEDADLRKCICNFFGHTHQKTNFYEDRPYMYHVGVDSHACTPVSIDRAIADMEEKVQECLAQL